MTFKSLIIRSIRYHWRTNAAVLLGVAAAVAVLAGALVVGDSVRQSLRDIALGRLGRTDLAVTAAGFFREQVTDEIRVAFHAGAAAPLVIADGFVTHEPSGRRAAKVLVYGVDERFWRFHGGQPRDGVFVSPALASDLGARKGDVLLARLQRPSEVPIESLFGRKDDVGRTVRLTLDAVLPLGDLGEFALRPQQAGVRAIFAPLRRIQRDLDVRGQVNTVLVAGGARGGAANAALRSALSLADRGVRVSTLHEPRALVVDTSSGILSDAVERAVRTAGERAGLTVIPVLTYLANTLRKGDRQVPYSLITATDLGAMGVARSQPQAPAGATQSPIVLNTWAARELAASPGDRIDLEYYIWDAAAGLSTRTASFAVGAVVPIEGPAADRRLAPDYEGITGADSLADWDPPFPIDLSRVRPVDERYWDEFRTTPKAFIPYERGRELWASRYGATTSIRLLAPNSGAVDAVAERLRGELQSALSPQAMGIAVFDARHAALEASRGSTDFGEYFTYFSFFLVVSALLLTVLFFKLGVEQRLRQIGILRAAGFTIRRIRTLLLAEASAIAVAGAVLGLAGAIAYAHLIVYGLRTWWVGAVGTTSLTVHAGLSTLSAGAAGGVLAAVVCVFVSLRGVGRASPRTLLSAQTLDVPTFVNPARGRRNRQLAALLAIAAASLVALSFAHSSARSGAFFGAGAALLVAFVLLVSARLRARDRVPITGNGAWAVSRLGMRSAAFRPSRSALSVALIASAVFIIVSVGAFRRTGGELTTDPKAGTGGYAVMAEAEIPLVHDPDVAAGREALVVQAPELANARFTRFRVRQGDDASCLNLYRPTNPTIVAPEPRFLDANRFTFSSSLASTDAERANPWRLLQRRFEDGSIPVVADATSLQYALHAAVGDTMTIDTGGRSVVVRFVGALRDSVLQGQLVMAEERFVTLFPAAQGYQLFLIDDPDVKTSQQAEELAGILERELQPYGVDAIGTTRRLDEFHRVENTYLSTFQALGGLGLLLGTIGLATVMFRNVLERRRELALLRAVGYDRRRLSLMIVAEAAFLLIAGLVAGVVCAAVAIAPAWVAHSGSAPGLELAALLVGICAAGIVSSVIATRAALAGRLLDALRAE